MRVLREGPVRITKTAIDAAWRRRAKGTRLVLGDAECRGLALVVNQGSMAWTFSYKPRGTDPVSGRRFSTRSVTIGTPASHSPDDARAEANRLKGRAKSGRDPAAERREKAVAVAARRARTLGRLLDAYAAALPRRPKLRGSGTASAKHVSEEIAHARAAISAMKTEDKPASEVTAADLRTLLNAEAARPAVARHRFGALSRFFDWCQDEGHVAANPCALVAKARRPRAVAARAHFLGLEQLVRVWNAAEELPHVNRDLVRFIVAVPCRRGEAARLDWSHLDLVSAVWTQPGRLTKNGSAHRAHLHVLALALLRERHVAAGRPVAGLVFPAPQSGGPVDTFSDIKAALDKAAGLAGWRFHDLRRSFATALGERGIPEPVADAVLNHRQAATRGGVLGVYQRAQRWPEQVGAMNAWGAMLSEAIEAASVASGEAGA